MEYLQCGKYCKHWKPCNTVILKALYTCKHTVLLVTTIIFLFYSWENWGTQLLRGDKGHIVIKGQNQGLTLRSVAPGSMTLPIIFFCLFKCHHLSWSQWYCCEFHFTELKHPTKTFWVGFAIAAKNRTSLLRNKQKKYLMSFTLHVYWL